jgi:putative mRNA 3-end processing factor
LTQVQFLGGCKTIGSSAYLIKEKNDAVLLDFGASFNGQPTFPRLTRPQNLSVFLSHAHLDHSGGLPMLFASGSVPVYMTAITRELIRLLLRDMIRLSEYFLPFEKEDLQRLLRRIKIVEYEEPIELSNGMTITFYDAGHIPGSANILVETNSNRVLYTGDINTIDTQLLSGAKVPFKKPDTVIMESTYALTSHKPRNDIEKAFIEAASEVLDNGGVALVPAFAVARAQEIICILARHKFPYPIFLDGMARDASRIFLRYPSFFRNYPLLRNALSKAKWVRSPRDRKNILKQPCVMVAPAGMLRGGTAAMYLGNIMHNRSNAVILVGYQIPGTPGRDLLEQGTFNANSIPQKVKAKVHFFDFSSHAGQDQLLKLARSFSNIQHLYTVHGEAEACQYLATTLQEQDGFNAMAAETGQQIEL